MTDGNIKREEIKALMEVHSKSTEHTVLIAERLKIMAELLDKICERVSDGITKDIIICFKDFALDLNEELTEIKKNTKEARDDVAFMKIIIGASSFILFIAAVLQKIFM